MTWYNSFASNTGRLTAVDPQCSSNGGPCRGGLRSTHQRPRCPELVPPKRSGVSVPLYPKVALQQLTHAGMRQTGSWRRVAHVETGRWTSSGASNTDPGPRSSAAGGAGAQGSPNRKTATQTSAASGQTQMPNRGREPRRSHHRSMGGLAERLVRATCSVLSTSPMRWWPAQGEAQAYPRAWGVLYAAAGGKG